MIKVGSLEAIKLANFLITSGSTPFDRKDQYFSELVQGNKYVIKDEATANTRWDQLKVNAPAGTENYTWM